MVKQYLRPPEIGTKLRQFRMARRYHRPSKLDVELRLLIGGSIVIGPRQARLLEEIDNTGSISAAQRQMGASYAHVWHLMANLNEGFSPPLIEVRRGGANGSGASLTAHGHKVLKAFRGLEQLLQTEGHGHLKLIGKARAASVKAQPGPT